MGHLEYPANLSPLTVFEQWEEATQTQREDANSTQIPELNRLNSGPSCCHPMPVLVPLYVFVLLTSIRMLPEENIIIQENARTLSSACSRFIVFGSWMSQEQKKAWITLASFFGVMVTVMEKVQRGFMCNAAMKPKLKQWLSLRPSVFTL